MKDVRTGLVGLATRLGYKVYKEYVEYDDEQPVLYMVKNENGVKFTGIVLNAVLAKIIKYDMENYRTGSNMQKGSLSTQNAE